MKIYKTTNKQHNSFLSDKFLSTHGIFGIGGTSDTAHNTIYTEYEDTISSNFLVIFV